MARGYYDTGVRTASLSAAGNLADLRAGASIPLRVTEIGLSVGVVGTGAPTLALLRETATGVASTTTVPQAEEPSDPTSTGNVGTAWSTAPTLAAVAMRRISLPATVGAGWIWTWSEQNPLIVPVSTGLMIQLNTITAASAVALDVYFKHLE